MARGIGVGAAWAVMGLTAIVLVAAPIVAPYDATRQFRDWPLAPPTPIRFRPPAGAPFGRPFVYPLVADAASPSGYAEDRSVIVPLEWLTDSPASDSLETSATRRHLVGVAPPAALFVFGTDRLGRDVFSRFVVGARRSLAVGLGATLLALAVAGLAGAAAALAGGLVDESLMRLSELVLMLPWMFVLLAVRALLPLDLPATTMMLALMTIIAASGWARPARLVRGAVLAARHGDVVAASRAAGSTWIGVARRHLWPQLTPLLGAQAAVLLPRHVHAEVTLSFLGLGLADAEPSWGVLLADLARTLPAWHTWWMWLPLGAMMPVFWAIARLTHASTAPLPHSLGHSHAAQ